MFLNESYCWLDLDVLEHAMHVLDAVRCAVTDGSECYASIGRHRRRDRSLVAGRRGSCCSAEPPETGIFSASVLITEHLSPPAKSRTRSRPIGGLFTAFTEPITKPTSDKSCVLLSRSEPASSGQAENNCSGTFERLAMANTMATLNHARFCWHDRLNGFN